MKNKILKEVFGLEPGGYRKSNAFWNAFAIADLIAKGYVRHIGLSNESPYGVAEFVRLAEQHRLPRVATVQNPYALTSRALDNGLDEVMHRLQVSLLAYSPLAFGALTGKYDSVGLDGAEQPGRLAMFDTMKKQRWARPEAIEAARLYNALARRHGLTPAQLALAFCYGSWRVGSTIIGATSLAQLQENLDAARGVLSDEVLRAIEAIHLESPNPAP